jgi:hypothetical protein
MVIVIIITKKKQVRAERVFSGKEGNRTMLVLSSARLLVKLSASGKEDRIMLPMVSSRVVKLSASGCVR